ncbi:kinase-like protein [Piedraia hortae CBS 480.64]|uniref:non-specific serine/threonine protein kinase n=1 Tax=Piedraia hortae CBS 480.64 TaxID=1314780 RepID=A0A6A7BRC0_9PEZI|nr:kinase-like protein [Piedraia hortae CBS 480.64]
MPNSPVVYCIIRHFGRTGGGQARLAQNETTGKFVVIKTIRSTSSSRQQRPLEIIFLYNILCPHTNIITLQGFSSHSHGSKWDLVFECCNGGDLNRMIEHWQKRRPEAMPRIFIKHFIASLVSALMYIHHGIRNIHESGRVEPGHKTVIHNDIKPGNVFLRWNRRSDIPELPEIVLGDFGLACLERNSRGVSGTMRYTPPEAWRYETTPEAADRLCVMTAESDIFGFGATLWEVVTTTLFNRGRLANGRDEVRKRLSMYPATDDPGIMRLILDSLATRKRDRPTKADLIAMGRRCYTEVRQERHRLPLPSWPRRIC